MSANQHHGQIGPATLHLSEFLKRARVVGRLEVDKVQIGIIHAFESRVESWDGGRTVARPAEMAERKLLLRHSYEKYAMTMVVRHGKPRCRFGQQLRVHFPSVGAPHDLAAPGRMLDAAAHPRLLSCRTTDAIVEAMISYAGENP